MSVGYNKWTNFQKKILYEFALHYRRMDPDGRKTYKILRNLGVFSEIYSTISRFVTVGRQMTKLLKLVRRQIKRNQQGKNNSRQIARILLKSARVSNELHELLEGLKVYSAAMPYINNMTSDYSSSRFDRKSEKMYKKYGFTISQKRAASTRNRRGYYLPPPGLS